jgi:hypothetical protein
VVAFVVVAFVVTGGVRVGICDINRGGKPWPRGQLHGLKKEGKKKQFNIIHQLDDV